MIARNKKFTALFLVFSLMVLSVNLYAEGRRGAKLMVTKKDGQQVEGELITVKPNSLLLLNTEGKDVSVNIANIRIIRIVKKPKIGIGVGIGFLIGGATGALTSIGKEKPASFRLTYLISFLWLFISQKTAESMSGLITGIVYGTGGALIGGLIGATAGKDKTIKVEGKSDLEIQNTLEKLRKKARVRNYK